MGPGGRVESKVRGWAISAFWMIVLFAFLATAALIAGALRIREVESALQIGRMQVQIEQIRRDISKLESSLRIYEISREPQVLHALSRESRLLETDIDILLRTRVVGTDRIREARMALPPIRDLSLGDEGKPNALKIDLFEASLSELESSIESFGQNDSRLLGEAMAQYSTASTIAVWLRTLLGTLVVVACYFVYRKLRSDLRHERAARAQTEFILESVAGAFFTVDSQWRVKFANANAARLVGMEPSEIVDKSLWDVFVTARDGSVREHLTEAMEARRNDIREHQSERDDRWFELRAYPFEQGLSITWLDTTERHLEKERLVHSEELALQASNAKSLFLASMSHEIRTPLNAIVGSMSLLEHEDLPPSAKELVVEAEASGQMLMRIIGDILDYSRVEAGELTMVPVPTDVEEVVNSVASLMQARAAVKNLEFVVKGPQGTHPHVSVDAVRLRQVMINLLSNALKFTSSGSVTLDWQLAADEEIGVLEFAVRDTGVGIPRSRLAAIFDPFTQANPQTHARFGGAGLGLAICKEIVGAMGGSIGVSSVEGSGSEFRVSLPLPLAEQCATVPKVAIVGDGQSLEGLKVLLVDDSPVNVKIATRILERCGCDVTSVDCGQLAVAAALDGDYDAILMDVILPDIDGLEAVRRIRAYESQNGGHRQVIALTANAMSEHEVACHEAGMDAFLTKPVTLNALRDALTRHAARSASQGPAAQGV